MAYSFVTPADRMNMSPGERIGWLAPEDNSDQVQRDGYRSVEQMVREMTLAGERLEDWRSAAYPAGYDWSGLETVPVFGDELDTLDRFRALQARRRARDEALEIDRINAEQLKAKEAADLAAREAPPEPVLVRVVPDK